MKTTRVSPLRLWRAAGALVLVLSGTVATARADDRRDALLDAIHSIENPRDLPRPGSHGELGAYQFRASTWRMHTSVPFRQALDRETSDEVAIKHYEWLKRGLEAARVPASHYNIALAWNGGLSAAIRGRSPRAAHKYAQRAVNLVSTYVPPASAPTPVKPVETRVVNVMEWPQPMEKPAAVATFAAIESTDAPFAPLQVVIPGTQVVPMFQLGVTRVVADAR